MPKGEKTSLARTVVNHIKDKKQIFTSGKDTSQTVCKSGSDCLVTQVSGHLQHSQEIDTAISNPWSYILGIPHNSKNVGRFNSCGCPK